MSLFGMALDAGSYMAKGVNDLFSGGNILSKFSTDYSEVALNMAKGYKANATRTATNAGETILKQAFKNADNMDDAARTALRKKFFEGAEGKRGLNAIINDSIDGTKISASELKGYLDSFATKYNVDAEKIIDDVSDAYSKTVAFEKERIAAGKSSDALKSLVTGNKGGAIRTAKAYFGDADKGAARTVGAAGAWMGVSVGGRLVSGGNAVRNNRGESDIAGIPFV